MIRFAVAAAALGLVTIPASALSAEDKAAPAAAPASKYSVDTTTIGDILDNKELKAILVKHLPDVANGEQIDMARAMTLRDIQPYAPEVITDEKLAAIDAEIKKVS